jgi:DEAD/DEAH box helicase domain-containing protein
MHNDRFKIVNRDSGVTITEMCRPQVYREAHTRAVYLHDGVQYQVEKLDLTQHVATVTEVEQNFYTQPDVRTAIDVLLTQEERTLGLTAARFGDVRVDESVVGYKMLEFHNHQNLGYETLHEALRLQLETEAVWIPVPERVLAVLGGEKEDALGGMVHALSSCARMRTMAERTDLVGTSFHCVDTANGRTETALILHDSHPGGLGYAATAYEHVGGVLADALSLVDDCRCKDGCPACVGSYGRDRRLIAWALHGLLEERPVPDECKTAAVMSRLAKLEKAEKAKSARLRIPWEEVEDRVPELIAGLRAGRVDGAEYFAKAVKVACRGHRLVVTVESPGMAEWLRAESVQRRLWPAIAEIVVAPKDACMVVEVASGEAEGGHKKAQKLRRRHDDLTGGAPESESQANDTLAGGYVLAQDVKKPN